MDTKSSVLRILSSERGYVSGEAISRQLGVSRAAVNIAVKTLRAGGYCIESATNRGYKLKKCPDIFNSTAMGMYLTGERMERVEVFDTIDSTSSELMRRLAGGILPSGTAILANSQTSGRGRRGRSFDSPSGKGIYLSYLFVPTDDVKKEVAARGDTLIWASITSCTAVAVSDALEEVCGVRPSIKWVNDLFLNGRKLCGILTQMSTSAEDGQVESIIIGIGINVRHKYTDFPDEIRGMAGSIYTELDKLVPRAMLAAAMIKSLDEMIASWPQNISSYHKKYIEKNIVIGKTVNLSSTSGTEQVYIEDIDEDFALIARTADGSHKRVISGDVTLRVQG